MSGLLFILDFMSARMRYVFALRDTGLTVFGVSAWNLNFLVCLVITKTKCKVFLVIGDAILKCDANIVNDLERILTSSYNIKYYLHDAWTDIKFVGDD